MFTNKDLIHFKNLQRLLSKARMDLQGEEVLAAADVMIWVGRMESRITEDIQRQEAMAKAAQGTEKIQGPEKPHVEVVSKPKKQSKKTEAQ